MRKITGKRAAGFMQERLGLIILAVFLVAIAVGALIIFNGNDLLNLLPNFGNYTGSGAGGSPAANEWSKILQSYSITQCQLDLSTCKASPQSCSCFSRDQWDKKINPGICDSRLNYCYEFSYGCTGTFDTPNRDMGSPFMLNICRDILEDRGLQFKQAPVCEIDSSTCKVKNVPCTCPTSDELAPVQTPNIALPLTTCTEDFQYCYYNSSGCSNTAPTTKTTLDLCKKAVTDLKQTFVEPVDCEIQTVGSSLQFCMVKNPGICNCINSQGEKRLCLPGQFCYYKGIGCSSQYPKRPDDIYGKDYAAECDKSIAKFKTDYLKINP